MKQQLLKEQLIALARTGKLLHAYILESRRYDDLIDFADMLAKEITPYREDIHRICADELSVKDKAVEDLLERLSLKPMVGEYAVAVIQDADTMTSRAQNRLLKSLEEPPGRSILLLLTNNSEHLLPTIRSRCALLRLDEESRDEGRSGEASASQAHTIGSMILEGKSYYAVTSELREIIKEREQAYDFLDALEKWYRDLLLCKTGVYSGHSDPVRVKYSGLLLREKAYEGIALIEEARRDLDHRMNIGYTMKNMILKMI